MPENIPRPRLHGGAFPGRNGNFWSFIGKIHYVAIAIVEAKLAVSSDNPTFGLEGAPSFIFGPKIWQFFLTAPGARVLLPKFRTDLARSRGRVLFSELGAYS